MKEIYYIEDLEQLKVISDPLRVKVLWEITEEAKTGKMIADILEIPAPKVHYHLKELERAGLILIEKTEEKNGIIQKFYRPIARVFSVRDIDPSHREAVKEELAETLKENILISLDKTKSLLRKVDAHLFNSQEHVKFGYEHVRLNQDQWSKLQNKAKEMAELISSFKQENNENGETHHFFMLSFPLSDDHYPEE